MGLFSKFTKKDMDKKCISTDFFLQFTRIFKPSNNLVKPTEEELKKFREVLPYELLCFWQEYGFGNYGNGIIKVISA